MLETSEAQTRPHRRRLLFIPGFDPRSPAAYHRIWKREAPRQAEVSSAAINVGKLAATDDFSSDWRVDSLFDGRPACTQVTVLRWDDLVRQWWISGDFRIMAAVPGWAWRLARHGVYGLSAREARPFLLSLLTPPLVIALILLLAAGLLAVSAAIHPWLIPLAALGAAWLAAFLWRRADRWLGCAWLCQCLNYFAFSGVRPLPEQEDRCALFAERLIAAADDPEVDEVILAGFSLGAGHAIRAMAMALRQRPDLGRSGAPVRLLTLGQSCGTYACMPDAAFLGARRVVAEADHIGWVDATSASDPASACRVSPLHGLEAAPAGRPEQRPPRFHRVLTPERFRAIRRNPLAFHFQYLNAVDLAGGYNWFAMAAGPDPLIAQKATS